MQIQSKPSFKEEKCKVTRKKEKKSLGDWKKNFRIWIDKNVRVKIPIFGQLNKTFVFPRQKSSQPHIRLFFSLSNFAIWLEKKNRMRVFCSWRVWLNEFTRWKLEMCARFCCCSSNLLNLLRVSDDSVRKRVN